MEDQEYYSQDQKKVNHPTGDMEGKPTCAPYTQENKKENQKQKIADHWFPFAGFARARRSRRY
jgi:hypothetical protein